jgi:predicted secreted hydrolase
LSAANGEDALELDLTPTKPVVLQGENGLSRKGREPGNASYYYSLPRLDTRGTLTLDGRQFTVAGASWFDREWSTSVLEHGQVGWDWFALQLDDRSELMVFDMRRDDGSLDAADAGTFVARDGTATALGASDFTIEVLAHWKSERSGAEYPSKWRVRVPSRQLDLEVEPALADQELRLSVRYWEGAVRVTANGKACGCGYVELTGY